MKVIRFDHGSLITERLFESKYDSLCKKVFEQDDFLLPTYKSIRMNYQYPDEVRMLYEDTFIEVETETEIIRAELGHLWFTDFGSVPRILRSFADNDGKALWCWILHDAMFGINAGFTFSNEVLRAFLEFVGYGVIVRNAVYSGVQYTTEAKKAYRQTQYQRSGNQKFINLTITKKPTTK